jgi:hypothetical protein
MTSSFRSRFARFAFHFMVVYFGAYFLPITPLWNVAVQWAAPHVFHVSAAVLPNGSGDTTWNYVQVFCIGVLASTGAALWSLVDRLEADSARHRVLFRLWIRFWLATAMLSYGVIKVVPMQFPAPAADLLDLPYGDASPMGALWRFMGTSAPYTMFAGTFEVLAGSLLAFRRTTLLGSLVAAAVLVNIVALNFCYDVPVKLYSLHLLAMAIILAAPDAGTLLRVFITHQPAAPVPDPPLFQSPRATRILGAATGALLVYYVTSSVIVGAQQRYSTNPSGLPLAGSWRVDTITLVNDQGMPVDDRGLWRSVTFYQTGMLVRPRDRRVRFEYYTLTLDAPRRLLKLLGTSPAAPDREALMLRYTLVTPEHLELDGTAGSGTLRANLTRIDAASFQLTTRGFHWINEYPFNR